MLGALVAFLAAFACFFGAIKRWPFPSLAKPGFPDLTVEIFGASTTDTEREAGSGLPVPAHLRSFTVRVTNAEPTQNASLTVLLYVALIPGSWGRAGEAVCPPPDWTLPPSLGLSPITMPLALSPGAAISGQLVYEIPEYYLDRIAEPMNARLELWDHVTGRRVTVPAHLGNHGKSEMTASSGGAAALGPEYESQAGQPDDAGRG
jgi:hypothetical protein